MYVNSNHKGPSSHTSMAHDLGATCPYTTRHRERVLCALTRLVERILRARLGTPLYMTSVGAITDKRVHAARRAGGGISSPIAQRSLDP